MTPAAKALQADSFPSAEAYTRPATAPHAMAAFATIAAVALGSAIHFGNGAATPDAMTALSAALIAFAGAVAARRLNFSADSLTAVIGSGLAIQFVLLATSEPFFMRQRLAHPEYYSGAICVAAMLAGVVLAGSRRWRGIAFGALLGVFAATSTWLLYHDPNPRIDVIPYQKIAIDSFVNGINPYAIDYPNIYTMQEANTFYGPGIATEHIVRVGYPYMPIILLLSTPAELLFGDFRIGEAVALLLTAFFIAHARPSRWSFAAATLLLFTPRSFFILDQGWTEPFLLMLLAGSAWCWYRAPRVLPFALGLFFASKQYLALAAPLLLLVLPGPIFSKPSRVFALKLVAAACVVTLPLALINLPAFLRSTVWMFLRTPYRADSLSFLTWFSIGGQQGFPLLSFALPLCIIAACCVFLRRGFVSFVVSFVAVMLPFFAMNKQAFANYYFLLIGALCLLVALVAGERQNDHAESAAQPPSAAT